MNANGEAGVTFVVGPPNENADAAVGTEGGAGELKENAGGAVDDKMVF